MKDKEDKVNETNSEIGCDSLGCVFITAVPITKLFARGGGGNGGHVLKYMSGV